MKPNEKKNFIIVIVAMAVLIFVLIGGIIGILSKLNQEKSSGQEKKVSVEQPEQNTGKTDTIEDQKEEDPFSDELEEEEQNGHQYNIVVNGVEMHIPAEYGCTYIEDIGVVIYLDGMFYAKLAVRDDSYEEVAKNPETLTEKVLEAGGEVTKEVTETELDGKKYLYFRCKLEDTEQFVVHTQAANTDKRIAAQIALESDELGDEELIHIFADIIAAAKETDRPDTTEEDLREQEETFIIGEKKSESTLTLGNQSVTFPVTEGYYSQYTDSTDEYSTENFTDKEYAVDISCYLRKAREDYQAKEYIEMELDFLNSCFEENWKIQTEEAEGKTFYYVIAKYEYDGSEFQNIYAACDITGEAIYSVTAKVIDEDINLTMDSIRDFLMVKTDK